MVVIRDDGAGIVGRIDTNGLGEFGERFGVDDGESDADGDGAAVINIVGKIETVDKILIEFKVGCVGDADIYVAGLIVYIDGLFAIFNEAGEANESGDGEDDRYDGGAIFFATTLEVFAGDDAADTEET